MILLPLAYPLLRRNSLLWPNWRRFGLLALLGVGSYNALQYLALKTSTPMNVTLVAASSPVWMLGVGALFFGQGISARQLLGAALSIAGVLLVLSRGDPALLLQVRLVPGDVYVLLATLAWAFYCWLLSLPNEPVEIRRDWSAFLMAQVVFGLGWAGLFRRASWLWARLMRSGAGRWPWPCCMWPWGRRYWPTELSAWAYSGSGPPRRAFLPTSRRCSRP